MMTAEDFIRHLKEVLADPTVYEITVRELRSEMRTGEGGQFNVGELTIKRRETGIE